MLDTIGAFGSGIGTNLLSDSLSKKLEAFKDKKAIASFTQSLRDWEIEFEKQNDGTIITNGAFYSHVKYHNVIENIVAYVLEPSMNAVTEDEFLNCLHEEMVSRIEETTEKKLSWNDSRLIRNFLTHLLTTTRSFLFQKISLEDRGLFYLVCQNNAKLENLERIVKEKFQMQDQNVQQIVEQLSMAIQKSETEERIKAKMASWNSRQIKNLGNRYTPDLNIPVEIMDSLHGASVDQQFQNIFYDKVDKFLIAMRHTELSEINALCDAIEKYAIELNFFNITSSDIDVIISTVNAIKDFLTSKIEEYYENPEGKKNFDSKAYQLYEKLGIANEFNDYLTNTTVRVAVSPYIILAGDGGVGKSHLIADYIDNCDSLGQTSLLLLGQQFSAGMDVLAILPTLLGCDITYHELFDIFEAIACAQKSRVLICIDALNEGAGVTFWNSVLGGLVDFLKEFPHIGLLVSVRTQYEDPLFDGQDTLRAQMQRIEHFGFTTVEHDAMHQYFSSYGITIDPVVFPISEFRNPLFLRLFCTANRNTHISLGDISLPFVYSQYISVMEQKVAKRCNYNKSYKLISKIIDEMVSKRINEHSGTVSLSLDDTLALIVDICKKWNVNTDVYSALLAEGVLTQGITYNGDEYVYITYERLEDYFLAQKIVSAYVVKNEYAESLICALSGVDFMGRWMPEAQSNSAMYNKEYYWSDAHTFFNNPYYCGLEWVNIDSDRLNYVFPGKVLIPVKQYYSERKGALNCLNSEIASIYWHKPCEEIYTKLQLKYLKGSNSAFVDGTGELVCFDGSELIGNDTGFYIRYDKLLEFLKSSSYTLVWTSLCEKRILTPPFGRWDLPPKAIHMSSVYYLKDGKITKASETLFEDRLYY